MESLQAMNEHRAIVVVQHVLPYSNLIVRRDSDQMCIECGVMERAKREAVGNDCRAERICVRNDVSRLQQLVSSKATDRAVMLIRPDNSLTKLALMQALSEQPRYASAF